MKKFNAEYAEFAEEEKEIFFLALCVLGVLCV